MSDHRSVTDILAEAIFDCYHLGQTFYEAHSDDVADATKVAVRAIGRWNAEGYAVVRPADLPPDAPSVDVEKLRELCDEAEAKLRESFQDGSRVPGAMIDAGEAKVSTIAIRALLDSAPSVDYGQAETQYGVRHPSGFVSSQAPYRIPYNQESAEVSARHSRSVFGTELYEAVQREARFTLWRPVDGAPEEGEPS